MGANLINPFINATMNVLETMAFTKCKANKPYFKKDDRAQGDVTGVIGVTGDSGTAITNRPGTNGLGSISPNSLEQSNVDIANEFVKMITTQRGFQANSKIVTTVDAMLGEVINMKR